MATKFSNMIEENPRFFKNDSNESKEISERLLKRTEELKALFYQFNKAWGSSCAWLSEQTDIEQTVHNMAQQLAGFKAVFKFFFGNDHFSPSLFDYQLDHFE
ncbi:hypothetical protein PGT21_024894 [Puccinia graminis f. sp. tritici]|uniref:Uncharacterized protein n=1 Tax=Puccinia graminis f. sp. tritici TaxID=56615 RepID=A0A5B0LP93_PUCGR|nr:hypothetical protein PGT21_024894 [Puccinia graminis f. sp. tritici]